MLRLLSGPLFGSREADVMGCEQRHRHFDILKHRFVVSIAFPRVAVGSPLVVFIKGNAVALYYLIPSQNLPTKNDK